MVTPSWMDLFPNARLLNLVAPVSYHNPIMVHTSPIPYVAKYRPFQFENKWLEEPDLKRNKDDLRWKIQQLLSRSDDQFGDLLAQTRAELGKLLLQEEAHWRQRAKVYWLRDEDFNTNFFHQTASARRRVNKIE
ncbi:hypothetical protein ACS0TY_005735 [Phlomoides rotata]